MSGPQRPFRPTVLYRIYALVARCALPFAYRKVARKLAAAKVPNARIRERLGYATVDATQTGPLIWFHAASVGESLSVLTLIARLSQQTPDLSFLITTGTATSAEILAKRMPKQCQHQFAPLDHAPALRRFLAHWQPDLAVFVESELWPQMLVETAKSGVPLTLLNARLSERSVKNWARFGKTARRLLGLFSLIIAQTDATKHHLIALGADAKCLRTGQDLKAVAGPLPYDHVQLMHLQTQLGGRSIWIASSTHDGEEAPILAAHKHLLKTLPDALLILVPRHPERAEDIKLHLENSGLEYSQRTANQEITDKTTVYLADTLGETGLWYALAPLVFLGGSLMPIGGHNPFEPAHAGAAVLYGPHVSNMPQIYQRFTAFGGCQQVTAEDLGATLVDLLGSTDALLDMKNTAQRFANTQNDALDPILADLTALLRDQSNSPIKSRTT